MLKLHIPVKNEGVFIGQQMFGQEEFYKDGRECVAQRFVSYGTGKQKLAILNNSTYGCSFENNTIKLSLIRGATYCAHPVDNMPIVNYTQYLDAIDIGENEFHFRIGVFNEDSLEKETTEFIQPSYALCVGPTEGNYEKPLNKKVVLSNPNVSLVTMKKQYQGDAVILRLFNNSVEGTDASIAIGDDKILLTFGKFEVKTLLYKNGLFTESQECII
jgi:alpha-mannosidase